MEQHLPEQSTEKRMGPFFIMWGGQAFSLLGSQLIQFALVWHLTESTGSATVLALSTMMALLPQVFLSPFAGALVDRWNRRTVMIVADGLVALTTVVLVAIFAMGNIQVWHIYAAMLVRGAGGAFHWPAMQASTTLMVPEKHLSRIAGLNQSLQGAASIIAPPAGALLLEVLPMQSVLMIDILTAAMAIIPLFFIAVPQPKQAAAASTNVVRTMLADLGEGLRFVWNWTGLRLIIFIAMGINLLVVPAMSLMPLLVTNHFGGGALELASLQSADGIGMLAGGLLLGMWGGFRKRIATAMSGLIVMGLGIATIGFMPSNLFTLAVAAMLIVGIMSPIVNGSLFAAMQATVQPEMQGRVFTLIMSGASAMTILGLPIAGPIGDWLGVQFWYVIGGLFMVAVGTAAMFVPAIMNVEDNQPPSAVGGDMGAAEAISAD